MLGMLTATGQAPVNSLEGQMSFLLFSPSAARQCNRGREAAAACLPVTVCMSGQPASACPGKFGQYCRPGQGQSTGPAGGRGGFRPPTRCPPVQPTSLPCNATTKSHHQCVTAPHTMPKGQIRPNFPASCVFFWARQGLPNVSPPVTRLSHLFPAWPPACQSLPVLSGPRHCLCQAEACAQNCLFGMH